MKDKLPKGWKETTLNDVCDTITDGTHHTPKYEDEGVIFLSSKNVTKGQIDWSDVKYVSNDLHKQLQKRVSPKINDILLAKNGTTGVAAIVDKDLIFDIYVSLALLRPKNEILPKYLLNFINSPNAKEQFNSRLKGVGVPNLHLREIREVSLNLPSLDEQKQIVSVLDKIFEKLDQAIALLEENIQKLKQLNESVLDNIYGSLESEKVKLVSISEFEPKKAEVKNLSEMDCSFVPMAVLNERKINFYPQEVRKISEVYKGYTYFKDNDVLLAKVTPCFENGKSGVAENLVNGIGFGSSEYYVFRPSEKVLSKFIYYFISRQSFLIEGAKNMSGAVGLKRVTKVFIENTHIPLPSISEQQFIVAYLDQTTEKSQKLTQYYQNKLEALKRLKNSVLDSAFKGELRRAKVIPITQPVIDPYFARTKSFNAKKKADKQAMVIALAIEAHEKVGKSLYRTKGEKTVEVIEKHIDLDFGREAKKMAAGPAAFEHLVKIVEPLAKEKRWFSVQEVKGENYDSHKYIKAENFNAFMMRCVLDLKPYLQEIRRVIDLFANMKTTHEAEVVATTYSGWNNLIIRKIQINDEAIVTEARENWHDSKLKIERQEFFNAIEWLKKNNLVPKGNGKEVN
ncbi:Restriction endonuclease S subunit [Chryseobacterium sp. RU37D]|uniref:restriction endonuclease subunit S n=1 Tax=Chryseobacterium sp. RU37D TaxID=1907397 RepID=UPI000953F77B|nr:restriction endonuclease subunit S [Chryseobacterium sp. RU37D]SIQ65109.1 Restriction endonuclease S subunit [Chryseobacterium sp. RU37D]